MTHVWVHNAQCNAWMVIHSTRRSQGQGVGSLAFEHGSLKAFCCHQHQVKTCMICLENTLNSSGKYAVREAWSYDCAGEQKAEHACRTLEAQSGRATGACRAQCQASCIDSLSAQQQDGL